MKKVNSKVNSTMKAKNTTGPRPKRQIKSRRTIRQWEQLAHRRLMHLVELIESIPSLGRRGPSIAWKVDLRMIGSPRMRQLNQTYRGKNYSTDILSFPTVKPFWDQGFLGELVICLPVLKNQARKLGHLPELELEVLLVHGILHLLGFDHEESPREAKEMAKWEKKILLKALSARSSLQVSGLIDRTNSGSKNG